MTSKSFIISCSSWHFRTVEQLHRKLDLCFCVPSITKCNGNANFLKILWCSGSNEVSLPLQGNKSFKAHSPDDADV